MTSLAGRVAVVTGAAGGLGRTICEVFEREGAEVVGVDIKGDGVLELDVATDEGNQAMVEQAVARHGRLDILVVNAGVQHVAPIPEFDLADWDRVTGVLLRGPFLAMKHAWPHLVAEPGGRIVVTASVASFLSEKYKAAYTSAKHGVAGLVKVAALEGAPHGLTANAVAPGLMLTPLIENQLADQVRLHGIAREEILAEWLERGATDRAVETAEVAEVIAFLASSRASGISGAIIPVDLGLLVRY